MTELQSTDGSLFSRETDEEKSLESAEDMFSMIPDMDKEDAEKIGEWKKSSGNVKGGNEKGKRSLRMLQENKVDHRKILNESERPEFIRIHTNASDRLQTFVAI